jgi:hypothetical protein
MIPSHTPSQNKRACTGGERVDPAPTRHQMIRIQAPPSARAAPAASGTHASSSLAPQPPRPSQPAVDEARDGDVWWAQAEEKEQRASIPSAPPPPQPASRRRRPLPPQRRDAAARLRPQRRDVTARRLHGQLHSQCAPACLHRATPCQEKREVVRGGKVAHWNKLRQIKK